VKNEKDEEEQVEEKRVRTKRRSQEQEQEKQKEAGTFVGFHVSMRSRAVLKVKRRVPVIVLELEGPTRVPTG
jgi:hypothetical protein